MVRDKKCIGVLTSGGDAPGMNAAIRAVVRTAITKDIIPVGVIRGYNGLLEKNITRMDARSVSGIIQRGDTILKTARCKEFYEEKYREIAYQNAKELGLDGLVVIVLTKAQVSCRDWDYHVLAFQELLIMILPVQNTLLVLIRL